MNGSQAAGGRRSPFHRPQSCLPGEWRKLRSEAGGVRSNKMYILSCFFFPPPPPLQAKRAAGGQAGITSAGPDNTHRWLMLDLGSDAPPPIRHFLLLDRRAHVRVRAPKHHSHQIPPTVQQYHAGARPSRLGQANMSDVSRDGDETDSGCNILGVHAEVRGVLG